MTMKVMHMGFGGYDPAIKRMLPKEGDAVINLKKDLSLFKVKPTTAQRQTMTSDSDSCLSNERQRPDSERVNWWRAS